MGGGLVLSFTRVEQPGFVRFELVGAEDDVRALAAAVRARAPHGPVAFAERGGPLGWRDGAPLVVEGDADALAELESALVDVATRGRHRHVPLYDARGDERGELIVAAP